MQDLTCPVATMLFFIVYVILFLVGSIHLNSIGFVTTQALREITYRFAVKLRVFLWRLLPCPDSELILKQWIRYVKGKVVPVLN
jgi:hypothetical protein